MDLVRAVNNLKYQVNNEYIILLFSYFFIQYFVKQEIIFHFLINLNTLKLKTIIRTVALLLTSAWRLEVAKRRTLQKCLKTLGALKHL